METAVIVKVAVSAAPYSIDKPYDYLVPGELIEAAVPGVRVTVPFGRGNRASEGIILARNDAGEKKEGLKPLQAVLDVEPVLDSDGITLALWMRQRYFCTLFEAVKTILPAGLWYRFREVWHLAEGLDRAAADVAVDGVKRAAAVLDVLFAADGRADLDTLRDACGEEVSEACVGCGDQHACGVVDRQHAHVVFDFFRAQAHENLHHGAAKYGKKQIKHGLSSDDCVMG